MDNFGNVKSNIQKMHKQEAIGLISKTFMSKKISRNSDEIDRQVKQIGQYLDANIRI